MYFILTYIKLGLACIVSRVSLAYMYFQFPLMVLVMAPALDGLSVVAEAAENLGATTFQYWSQVAMPILLPSLLGQ